MLNRCFSLGSSFCCHVKMLQVWCLSDAREAGACVIESTIYNKLCHCNQTTNSALQYFFLVEVIFSLTLAPQDRDSFCYGAHIFKHVLLSFKCFRRWGMWHQKLVLTVSTSVRPQPLPVLSNFVFTSHLTTWRCVVKDSDNVAKWALHKRK